MTREERYKFIATQIHFADWFMYFHLSFDEELHQALKEAEEIINSLSAVPERETTDRIEYGTDGQPYKYSISTDITKENKGDLISRGEAESVLHNNLHALIDTDQLYQLYKDIDRLPTYSFSNSAENKGDLISRQTVLNLKQTFTDNAGYETEYVDVEDIKELPSISSVENRGEWIDKTPEEDALPIYTCSACGMANLWESPFCPSCGADMREGERMTKEKAITIIESHKAHWQRLLRKKICDETEGRETIEGFDIAIKALQEYEKYFPTPTEDCH